MKCRLDIDASNSLSWFCVDCECYMDNVNEGRLRHPSEVDDGSLFGGTMKSTCPHAGKVVNNPLVMDL